MLRNAIPLVAVLSILDCSLAFSQSTAVGQAPQSGTQTVRPGTPTGAQVPGMPPRDKQPPAQTGTARLRGRVVAAQTGVPLRRAEVTMAGTGAVRRTTTTDGEGRYEFTQVQEGQFTIGAAKAGYVSLQYGQKRPFEQGTPVKVADGAEVERVDFALPRGAVITVRVTDDFGDPLAGAQVQVQRYQYGPDGQRKLTSVATGFGIQALTDDRGEFRASGLMPGEYVISASERNFAGRLGGNPSDAAKEGLSLTFYPGTISPAEAQAISVGVGEEASAQFSLVTARLSRVSGTVVDSQGRPVAGAGLSLVIALGGSGFSMSPAGTVAPDGTFVIAGIAPGEYSIQVRPRAGDAEGEGAQVPITLPGDISGLRIATGKGATVSGRVVFEGTSARTSAGTLANPVTALRVTAVDPSRALGAFPFLATSSSLPNGTVEENGRFEIGGLSGRVFFGLTNASPAWVLKSVTLDGDDITDVPLDLTDTPSVSGVVIRMTDKLTQISGQVADARGRPVGDYVVVIQPAQTKASLFALRWVRAVRAGTNGRFETRGMPPGRYVATAIEALEQGRQFSPEFQEQLRRGASEFSVSEGESVTIDLRLTPDL